MLKPLVFNYLLYGLSFNLLVFWVPERKAVVPAGLIKDPENEMKWNWY